MFGVQCGLCQETTLEVITPEFLCCMNNDCRASYSLENKKDGTPIDWQEEPAVKIRTEKRFVEWEKEAQQKKDAMLQRRKIRREHLETKQLNRTMKPKPFF